MDHQTQRLLKAAVSGDCLNKLHATELFNELKKIFKEPRPELCLRRMQKLNILEKIHPEFRSKYEDHLLVSTFVGMMRMICWSWWKY